MRHSQVMVGTRAIRYTILLCCTLLASRYVSAVAQQNSANLSAIQNLIRSRQYGQAVEAVKKQLRLTPNNYRLWTLEGIALSLNSDASGAITAFDKALHISPDYMPALKGEAQLLYSSNEARALPLLERILKLDPNDVTAHEMTALLKRKSGDCTGALEHFAAIADRLGTHPASLAGYGDCLVQLKRYNDAVPIFEKLAAAVPDQDYPKYDLALVLVSAKQYDSALKALAPLLASSSPDPDALSLAAEAHEALGNTPQAVELLRQAIVLSPSTPDYYTSLAALCLDHDSFRIGIQMMDVGLQHVPKSAAIYLSRGLLHAQLAEYDAAEADFRKAEQLDATQSLSAYALDLAAMQKNNPQQALDQVRAQIKEHPNSPLLSFLLAKLLMDTSPGSESPEFKLAMQSVERAVQLKPDLVDAHNLLASMYMSTGQYDRAVTESRTALQYAPADESATYHLIISLRHTGQKDELPALVKRLSQLHQDSLKKETDRKRFRLEMAQTPPSP